MQKHFLAVHLWGKNWSLTLILFQAFHEIPRKSMSSFITQSKDNCVYQINETVVHLWSLKYRILLMFKSCRFNHTWERILFSNVESQKNYWLSCACFLKLQLRHFGQMCRKYPKNYFISWSIILFAEIISWFQMLKFHCLLDIYFFP